LKIIFEIAKMDVAFQMSRLGELINAKGVFLGF